MDADARWWSTWATLVQAIALEDGLLSDNPHAMLTRNLNGDGWAGIRSRRLGLERYATVSDHLADRLDQPEGKNRPLRGNRFRFSAKCHEMRAVPWKLLNAMWGHDERNMHDVEEEIWEVAGGSQLKDAQHDLKDFLEKHLLSALRIQSQGV